MHKKYVIDIFYLFLKIRTNYIFYIKILSRYPFILFKFNSAHPIDLTSDKKNYIYAGNGDAIACTNFSNPKIYNSIFALQSFAVEQSNIYNSGSMPIFK